MKFIFYIIYTPDTVKYLRVFTLSLLKWSNCSFCLVSNGCLTQEANLLERFCRDNPRLDFFAFPAATMVKHGIVLSYLQKQEKSDYFCFVDSDILATGDFLNDFIPYLDEHCAVFSGRPVWQKKEQSIVDVSFVPSLMGRFIQSDKGLLFGCSYFAVYNNKKLSDFIHSTGITFESYQWEMIPTQHQNHLKNIGLKKKFYDTGKVLNILLADQGEALIYRESQLIQHIGGLADLFSKCNPMKRYLPVRMLKKIARLSKRKIKEFLIKKTAWNNFNKKAQAELYVKSDVGEYFAELLFTLHGNLPCQTNLIIDDPEIRDQTYLLKNNIIDAYYEFKEKL